MENWVVTCTDKYRINRPWNVKHSQVFEALSSTCRTYCCRGATKHEMWMRFAISTILTVHYNCLTRHMTNMAFSTKRTGDSKSLASVIHLRTNRIRLWRQRYFTNDSRATGQSSDPELIPQGPPFMRCLRRKVFYQQFISSVKW